MVFYRHSSQRNLLFAIGLGIPSPLHLIRYLLTTFPYRYCHLSTSSPHILASHLANNYLRRNCLTPTQKNQHRVFYHFDINPHTGYIFIGKIKVFYATCLTHFSFHFRNYLCRLTHFTIYTNQSLQVSLASTSLHTSLHYERNQSHCHVSSSLTTHLRIYLYSATHAHHILMLCHLPTNRYMNHHLSLSKPRSRVLLLSSTLHHRSRH